MLLNLQPHKAMNTFITRAFIFVFGIFFILAPVPAFALDQPLMRDAVDLFRKAKAADDPLPLLQDALKKLENAAHDKGGFRVKAIEQVHEAIESVKDGDKQKTQDKIDHAIATVWAGINSGNRNRN